MLLKDKDITKELANDLVYEDATVLGVDCEACGGYSDVEEEVNECPLCGASVDNLAYSWASEGMTCDKCGHVFEPCEDNYYYSTNNPELSGLICLSCAEEILNKFK